MITCFLRYEIDIKKIAEFEHYGRLWIRLVNKKGGQHHGYLLPSMSEKDRDELISGPTMIQEFLPEVQVRGEWSLMFFGGEFSHAIRKFHAR